MSYLVIIAKNAIRISGKFLPAIKPLLVDELEILAKNPYGASALTGRFSWLRSWHVHFKGVPYRIIFEIEEKTKRVLVHLIAKRADAYRLLERLYK